MPDAYLDHAATTPMRPEAIEAVTAVLRDGFGNPSGAHRRAREARRLLDDARDVVAATVGAEPAEVVFTSGGTEADNLAVAGVTAATGRPPLCSAVEHHAVLRAVERAGGATIPVHPDGSLDLDALEDRLRETATGLVSVMLANNETGVVTDLAAVAATLDRRAPDAVLHTDAIAAAPWLDLVDRCRPARLVSVSGHKVGGPKGIGALIVRAGTPLVAQQVGGGQEQERRSGTPDVAGAVGLAAALTATAAERDETVRRVQALRDRLVTGLRGTVSDLLVLSPDDPAGRTAGTALVAVPGLSREALVFLLDEAGVAASWGSSCASGATEPSHVLAAMGVPPTTAEGSLRLTLGWTTTEAEIDHALAVIPAAVARLREAAA